MREWETGIREVHGAQSTALLVTLIATTKDVSIAGHCTCVHPAGHLKVSTEFTDLEGRMAY